MTEEQWSSSTAITSVYILRSNPRRVLAELGPAASRAKKGEFKVGEVIPGTRYRVLGMLGAGGMGSVYEVEHTELGKRFVLKALSSELAMREDLAARLRNEQRALGRLEHPNIVGVTDAGVTSENVPYFVMERLDGETLGARLKRLARLPASEALAIGAGVLDGLAAAHEIGVVHRDIKPQNILIVAGLTPKILDFGVAKVVASGSAITGRGVAVGTPRYMSPEQASGERVDGRSDLYAVGLVLFECVVGRGPFDDARDANEMLLAHLGRRAPSVSSLVPGITGELDEAVASLLAKAPAERPPTARAAAANLRAVSRRYDGLKELEAPTPHAGYTRTTRLFGLPLAPDADTTRAEPLAARARNSRERCDDEKTLSRGTPTGHDTLIDDPGPLLTVDSVPLATHTEIITGLGAPLHAGNDVTRTRVPPTAVDGSRTLDGIPAVTRPPPGRPSRRLTFVVGVAALLLGAGGAVLFTRMSAPASLPTSAARVRAPERSVPAVTLEKTAPAAPDPPEPRPERPVVTPLEPAMEMPVSVVTTRKNSGNKKKSTGLPSSGL